MTFNKHSTSIICVLLYDASSCEQAIQQARFYCPIQALPMRGRGRITVLYADLQKHLRVRMTEFVCVLYLRGEGGGILYITSRGSIKRGDI